MTTGSARLRGTEHTAIDPSSNAAYKFDAVLRHELAGIAARRVRLDTERGELPPNGVAETQSASQAAWRARLLGLSFSGGGIRSATFNLGVLQALARRGLLRHVDYLSTVAGGGYIGSWLTALCQRLFARRREDAEAVGHDASELLELNAQGFRELEKRLAWSAGDHADRDTPYSEAHAIRFLRAFSSYVTPKLALFSADTWASIAIYIRNALLNQLVLLFAVAAALLVPRLLAALLGRAAATDAPAFLLWMAAILLPFLWLFWKLGKHLANVSGLRAHAGTESTVGVLTDLGAPLLLIGISAASWLGSLDEQLLRLAGVLWSAVAEDERAARSGLPLAALLGSVANVLAWVVAGTSARRHGKEGSGATIERRFWSRMIVYAVPAGAVFGVLLHLLGAWLFAPGTYAGFSLIVAPPALALAMLIAGALHIGLAGKNVSAQYMEWLSRFGGVLLVGTLAWVTFTSLVFLGPLLVVWLQGVWNVALPSGLTALVSVLLGGRLATVSSSLLARALLMIAPWVTVLGVGLVLAALSQGALEYGTERFADPSGAAAARAELEALLHPPPVAQEISGRVEVGGQSVEIRGRVAADPGAAAAAAAAPNPQDSRVQQVLRAHGRWLATTDHARLIGTWIFLAMLITWILSLRFDINVFSVHGMYANRLARCYLGASVPERVANAFSGASSHDDLQLGVVSRDVNGQNVLVHPLADGAEAGGAPLHATTAPIYPGPYHLINTAINLTAGGNLGYQEKKTAAFLLSPLYCGFSVSSSEDAEAAYLDSYRPSAKFSSQPKKLTLGEAMATSGVGGRPGKAHGSTSAFAFLMSVPDIIVGRIRLGRWVGNPLARHYLDNRWRASGPKFALLHFLSEVFGFTDSSSAFVYLSDGGHFENLGIYELVRRRCRYIIACDASADEKYGFEDLANAIRKCRTDLGVEIDLDVRHLAETDADGFNLAPCAVGRIRYSEEDVGTILYIKPLRWQELPSDVTHYAREHPAFPHESAADRFLSESQFESYRRLGDYIASEVLDVGSSGRSDYTDVDRQFADVAASWYRPSRAFAASSGALADALDELFERLRTSKPLAFLSRQFHPEWRTLLGAPVVDARVQAQDQVFVPQDEEELRQGFYFCRSLILLMQRVFAALDLEREWQHVDHRGWMNALRQWAASGMLRITWAACATTYSRRFRAFGERRLGLTLGEVAAKSVFTGAPASHELEASGLSLHERQQVARLLPAAEAISLYRLDLIVQPPPPHDHRGVEFARFVFGYCVFRADNDELLMYRVRDHMRGVGLGRRGLRAVIEHRERPIRLGTIGGLTEILQSVGEQADAAQIVDFRALVFSVNAEWEATLGMTPPG